MTKAVLYVFHGSRLHEAKEEAITFFHYCREQTSFQNEHYAFLELATPTIEEGVKQCIKDGAKQIAVVPVLLFSAGHAKKDIPSILSRLKEPYPYIEFLYGKPLGVHDWMVEIVVEKVKKAMILLGNKPKVRKIILIARGSKDENMQNDFNAICHQVEENVQIHTEGCYLTAAEPSFQRVVEEVKNRSKEEQYIFIPYFLFTGLLIKKIEKELRTQPQEANSWILMDYIGQHRNIHLLVSIRAQEAFAVQT